MKLEDACTDTFARHETFHPRLGWFRKGFLAATRDDGEFFLAPDAPMRLGVGKNMVRSIKFWSSAARLITDIKHPDSPRAHRTVPTNLGMGILGPDGADPNMENPSTWWWLHWMLMSPGCQLPVWWIIINELRALEFTDVLAEQISVATVAGARWNSPNESSIHKDVSAFIRTFTAPALAGRGKFDDQFGCPLRELRLITPSPGGYRFSSGAPHQLAGEVVLAAALDFIAMSETNASTASFSLLATEPGGPGRTFRLDEQTMLELVDGPIRNHPDIELTNPAGNLQLGWRGAPAKLAHEILSAHFDVDTDEPALAGLFARQPNFDAELALLVSDAAREVVL